jgi:hypothetical protein
MIYRLTGVPIRLQIGMALWLLPVSIFTVLPVTTMAGGGALAFWPIHFAVIMPLGAVLARLFGRIGDRPIAGRTEIEETGTGLQVHWQPRTLADLMPWRNFSSGSSMSLGLALLFSAAPPVLAGLYALAHGLPFDEMAFWLWGGPLVGMILFALFPFFCMFDPRDRCRLRLTADGIHYRGTKWVFERPLTLDDRAFRGTIDRVYQGLDHVTIFADRLRIDAGRSFIAFRYRVTVRLDDAEPGARLADWFAAKGVEVRRG